MALSLLSQQPSFSDLQSFFDPFRPTFDFSYNNEQMEYISSHQHNSNQTNSNNNINNNSSDSNNNNVNSINNNHLQQNSSSVNQISNNSNRNYLIASINQSGQNSGYHHNVNNNYDQVINFVDSPPNSVGSWTDEQTLVKGASGPQIIEVQTIFTNSGSRKRRMDWDSLDINQHGGNTSSANGPTSTNVASENNAVAAKIPNLNIVSGNSVNINGIDNNTNNIASNNNNNGGNNNANVLSSNNDKEREKKKISGRGSWADEIDFDLNAEFNNNSYLNNETFLSFSPNLAVLKQEIQSPPGGDQLKSSKSPLQHSPSDDVTPPNDSPLGEHSESADGLKQGNISCSNINSNSGGISTKNEHNESIRVAGLPQAPSKGYEQTIKITNNPNASTNRTFNQLTAMKNNNDRRQSAANGLKSLVIVDSSKIENPPSVEGAVTTVAASSSSSPTLLSDDHKFQYILAAATSIATKNNEETLTYLNQGQSYEIKLKKTGDLSFYRDKILKSVIKICFHERRLQYMEREQMQQWQTSRPGERIIEVDIPLSYGLCHVSQPLNPNYLNTVEVFWDPLKEVGVYIKVNCISTEFTPKKHGGEKGVPFRIQIETYIENATSNSSTLSSSSSPASTAPTASGYCSPSSNCNNIGSVIVAAKQPVHAAACQIKVFKLKGADRKHKQDKEKIHRRPKSEQEKFQPSYECTIMNDIPLESITPMSNGCYSPEYMKLWSSSPVHIPKYDRILPYASRTTNSSPIAINSVTSTNTANFKLMDSSIVSPQQRGAADMEDYQISNIVNDSAPAQVAQWLTYHRLTAYIATFTNFSGSDILRMSKDDLIQICGIADGIRMFNVLHAKPLLTIYITLDGSSYNAIYLMSYNSKELVQKLFKLPGFYEMYAINPIIGNGSGDSENATFSNWGMQSKYSGSGSNIFNEASKGTVHIIGPSGVQVTITDEVVENGIKDRGLYALEVQNGKVLIKLVNQNEG